MKQIFYLAVGFLGLISVYLLIAPVPVDPISWSPAPSPGRTGMFEGNEALSRAERLAEGQVTGPEDTTLGPDGLLYTGLEDGRIIRFDPADPQSGAQPETVANTGGRPLGMQFDADGNLIIADALTGLLSLTPDGTLSVLTDQVAGEKLLFVDDLDIARDGTIWFSDASTRFDIHHNLLDVFESRLTGRLLTYSPATGETEVQLDNLGFANGVALAADESFVLVNETFRHRVTRLWLTGAQAGTSDLFIDNLPAYPDNISRAPDGGFWVALVAPRTDFLDTLMPYPFLRKVILRIPESLRGTPVVPFGWVIGLSADGAVRANLQDPTGHYSTITSVNETDGVLYLGSLTGSAVGRLKISE